MKKGMFKLTKCSILAMMILSSNIYAAGYKLEFQSSSILADAGEAAAINDAGTNWYNPAGLVYLPQQAVFSAIDVYAPTVFAGTVTAPSLFAGAPFGVPTLVTNGKASSHPNTILPAMHYTYPFKDRFAVGISVVPAWGFSEDYGEGSILRYDLTRVYTRTVDVSPSFAWKINDQWSIGGGPDIHYFSVESKSHFFGFPPAAPATDSIARFSANRWGYGGHVGVLFRINNATRIGLNYRSQLIMDLDGFSDFGFNGGGVVPGSGLFETRNFKLRVPLPPTTTLSIYHEVTPCFALLGTLAYDQWNILRDYHANNFANPLGTLPTVIQQQSMSNTLDASIGTHFKLTEQWLLRGSIKYEPTPTNDHFRDVNFPDGDKFGLQIGTRYQVNKKVAVDLVYGHVFVRTVPINSVYAPQIFPGNIVAASGHSRTSIDLFGAQLVWNI